MFHFSGLDHIQIAIPKNSEAVAIAFYEAQLGFERLEKPANLRQKGGVWFQVGVHQLHAGIQEPFAPATKAHPAFSVTGLKYYREQLESRGLKPRDEDELPGTSRFYLSDPFGNRLEFLERRRDE